MQPKTSVKFDKDTLERHIKTIKFISETKRQRKNNPYYSMPLPKDIGFQITRRCNLRCHFCMLWGNEGSFNPLVQSEREVELDISAIERVFKDSMEVKSNIFFWAAEPLIHKNWDDISKIIENDPRWTVLCTNGLLIEKKMESLLRISENLATVVSIDGFQEDHDIIRGKGMHTKLMHNLDLLFKEQAKGSYKGKVSIHCVINENLIPHLYEFMEWVESKPFVSIYFIFPWYISETTAQKMDDYYNCNFKWLDFKNNDSKPSWHYFAYHLPPTMMESLRKELTRLKTRTWNTRIRLQPAVEDDQLENFVLGDDMPVQQRNCCLSVSTRLDILADGNVTACQSFPEFSVGNIYEKSLLEIWKSAEYDKLRGIIDKGLTPVCSKCVLLYLNS